MPSISELKKSKNVVPLLKKEKLDEISQHVMYGYELDKKSRDDWAEEMKDVLKIAKQVVEHKTKAHLDNPAVIKYPLITKACFDFASRMYPEVIPNAEIVKASIIGQDDPFYTKAGKASRTSKCISYQLVQDSEDWEIETDHMLHLLPLFGTVFKKVYYDPITAKPMATVITPEDLVVNQNIKSLKRARRITHELWFHKNDIVERQRADLYSDIGDLCTSDVVSSDYEFTDNESLIEDEKDQMHLVLEQHCFFDLDEDGYDEPYIVTLHRATGKILRIVNRFKKIEMKKDLVKFIEPEHYFVDYHFIRSPDGSFYSLGIGRLLLPINETINTLIELTIDSGVLYNQQSGFLGSGLRARGGSIKLRQGEWKFLETTMGAKAKDEIVPLPTKEPSIVLFQLLGLMIESGKDLSSVTDVLTGKQPAQNVTENTLQQLINQGLKVYTAITKRVYRSLKSEFRRIFELNAEFLSDAMYQRILDDPLANVRFDFDVESVDILPVADPNMSTDGQRFAKAQQALALPVVDPMEASKNMLRVLKFTEDEIEKLIPEPDPKAPPPPEVQKTLADIELIHAKIQEIGANIGLKAEEIKLESSRADAFGRESEARIIKMLSDIQHNIDKLGIVREKSQIESGVKIRDQFRKEAELESKEDQKVAELSTNIAIEEMKNNEPSKPS